MPQKSTEQILNELFSKINNIILPADLSQDIPPMGFVTLLMPGMTVRTKDFDPAIPTGRENLYRIMDQLPAVNKRHLDSGRKCSDMYFQLLSAQTPADNPERAQAMQAEYDAAQEILHSKAYKDYKNFRDSYNDAQDEYLSVMNDSDLSSKERETLIRQAKRAMNEAMDDWISLGRKQAVEGALDTCARYLAFTPKSFFANAGRIYQNSKDPGSGLYPVICTPSDWATAPDELVWTEVVIKQDSSESKIHTDTKKIDSDFSASFSSGLWHASASGGYHDQIERINQSATIDKLGIAFEIARVNISRDWFSSALLTYEGTTIPGTRRGSICAGSLHEAAQCTFPFLPTAFVLARNIRIYNEFSHEEEQFLQEAQSWSASAKVGYGPFSLGNDTSSSHNLSTKEKKEFGNAVKMTAGEGIQIIGFLNTILSPAFPAKDSNRAALEQLTSLGDFLLHSTN